MRMQVTTSTTFQMNSSLHVLKLPKETLMEEINAIVTERAAVENRDKSMLLAPFVTFGIIGLRSREKTIVCQKRVL